MNRPIPSGSLALDEVLGGGFGRGALTQLTGAPPRALRAVALHTCASVDGVVTYVDAEHAFDWRAADRAGVARPSSSRVSFTMARGGAAHEEGCDALDVALERGAELIVEVRGACLFRRRTARAYAEFAERARAASATVLVFGDSSDAELARVADTNVALDVPIPVDDHGLVDGVAELAWFAKQGRVPRVGSSAFTAMLAQAIAAGLPRVHADDLLEHDRRVVERPGPFAWLLYDHGTHLVYDAPRVAVVDRVFRDDPHRRWFVWDGLALGHARDAAEAEKRLASLLAPASTASAALT